MPGGNWSLRWSCYSATRSRSPFVYYRKILEKHFQLTPTASSYKFYFIWRIGLHIQRHKPGQTSSPVFWTEIQTCCNITASSCSYRLFLGLSYVSMFFWKNEIAFTVALVLVIISVLTSVFSYTKVYRKLRQHQLQAHTFPQGQPKGRLVPLNIARYKKSVSSVLWVQLALVICYIPFIVVVMLKTYGVIHVPEKRFEIAFVDVAATLTYSKSSLNPILYCWRIKAVRKAAIDTIKQLLCLKLV